MAPGVYDSRRLRDRDGPTGTAVRASLIQTLTVGAGISPAQPSAASKGGARVADHVQDVVVDVRFDGRRVWSFWVLRDTERVRLELPPFAGISPFIDTAAGRPEPKQEWVGWMAVCRVIDVGDRKHMEDELRRAIRPPSLHRQLQKKPHFPGGDDRGRPVHRGSRSRRSWPRVPPVGLGRGHFRASSRSRFVITV